MTEQRAFGVIEVLRQLKLAQAEGPSAATSVSTVPQPEIVPTLAPGKRGPTGTAPRTNYSRVHTGVPPTSDAGAAEQKALPPKYGSIMNQQKTAVAARPTLQDMVKAAMAGAVSQAKIASEARRQAEQLGEPEKTAAAAPAPQAQEPGTVSTDNAIKYAQALEYLAQNLDKVALDEGASIQQSHVEPGKGPGALAVTQTDPGAPLPQNMGHARRGIPTNPGTERAHLQDPPTAMATNMNEPPGGVKAGSVYARNLARLGLQKIADDGEGGQIAAGAAAGAKPPAGVSATDEQVPAKPGNASLVSSNESAISMTRGQAKAEVKRDMNQLLSEPALSAQTDRVLQLAFDHTSEAGPKVASLGKAAAVALPLVEAGERGLLSRIAGHGATAVHNAAELAQPIEQMIRNGVAGSQGATGHGMAAWAKAQQAASQAEHAKDLAARLGVGAAAGAGLGGAGLAGYLAGRPQAAPLPEGMIQTASVKTAAARAILERLAEEQKLTAQA